MSDISSLKLPKETKERLYEYFKAYRVCKKLLARDMVKHHVMRAKSGYAFALNPDVIRKNRVGGSAPIGWGTKSMVDEKDRQWQDFVDLMDHAILFLGEYKRRIIRVQFLDKDTKQTDSKVWELLRVEGWPYSEKQFQTHKGVAMHELVTILKGYGLRF